MMHRPWMTGALCAVLFTVMVAVGAAAGEPPAPLYRLFLTDGTSVAAYGEWVRVGDRVVFTVAVGEAAHAVMHLASLPAERVDWPATERYRDGLRAASYAATRGDTDFAELADIVARLLSDASLAADPVRKLALADEARRRLVEWPAAHYGYRADEVRQILVLVDEVVSGLRAARGDTSFDLALVAQVSPPVVPLLPPPPTLRESIAQALRLADLAATPADRQSLLRTVSGVATSGAAGGDAGWLASHQAGAERALKLELEIDARYARLRKGALARAARAAARADVRGVEQAMVRYRDGDARLGGRRAETTQAVMAALEEKLDAARRLRLVRDRWALTRDALMAYRDRGRDLLGSLEASRRALEDIRRLAGPPPGRLDALERRTRAAQQQLAVIAAPPDAAGVHALVVSAAQLSLQAAMLRRRAIASADLDLARDASAAAAGALMLAERARVELDRLTRPPELQ